MDPQDEALLRDVAELLRRVEAHLSGTAPAPAPATGKATMNLREAAEATGLKVSTLRNAIQRGHLNARRLGNGPTTPYYIREKDLNEWLESRLVPRPAWCR